MHVHKSIHWINASSTRLFFSIIKKMEADHHLTLRGLRNVVTDMGKEARDKDMGDRIWKVKHTTYLAENRN